MTSDFLFSVRAAVIVAIALIVGIGAAWLTFYNLDQSWPAAALAGGAAIGGTLVVLHQVMGP